MENFGEVIKEWTRNEIEIKKLQERLKNIRSKNKELSHDLLIHIDENDLQDNTFNITSLQKKISIKESKITEPLTFKYLENCINIYFDINEEKDNKYHKENLLKFIKFKRQSSIKSTLEIN